MNGHCVFCKILAGAIPAKFAYQDEELIAIEDVGPQAPTHLLLIPRDHIPTVLDLRADHAALLGRIFATANRLALDRGLESGFRVVVNNGPDGGQTIEHLHFHLLGGRPMRWPPG
jgi:histidine triad (HIT) family protein